MSNMFGNAKQDLVGAEKERDVLGGKRKLLTTDIYRAKVLAMYVTESAGGARAFNFQFQVGDRVHRETVYVTNKKKEVFYIDKNNKKQTLPGYSQVNALTRLSIGKEIPDLVIEDKLIKVYDFESKKEVTKSFPTAVEMIGVEVEIAIENKLVNKRAKDQAGNYVDIAETHEVNEWTRVFHPTTGQTAVEYDTQAPSTFKAAWLAEFQGKQRDFTNKQLRAAAPAAGAPASTASPGPTSGKSLFGG